MAKGKAPLPWIPNALGLLNPASIMADDLPVHSHHSQIKMVLTSLPLHQFGSYDVQKRECRLHMRDVSNSGSLVSGGHYGREKNALGA